MRLLSKKEVFTAQQSRVGQMARSATRVQTILEDKRRELNELRNQKNAELSLIEEKKLKTLAELEAEIQPFRDEVASLENRKAEALKPITNREALVIKREADIQTKESEYAERVLALEEREQHVRLSLERIQDKLDDIDEQEHELRERALRIQEQEAFVRVSQEKLGTAWEEYVIEAKAHAEKKGDDLAVIRQAETAVQLERDALKLRETSLQNDVRKLESRQEALRQAIEYAKSKGVWLDQ